MPLIAARTPSTSTIIWIRLSDASPRWRSSHEDRARAAGDSEISLRTALFHVTDVARTPHNCAPSAKTSPDCSWYHTGRNRSRTGRQSPSRRHAIRPRSFEIITVPLCSTSPVVSLRRWPMPSASSAVRAAFVRCNGSVGCCRYSSFACGSGSTSSPRSKDSSSLGVNSRAARQWASESAVATGRGTSPWSTRSAKSRTSAAFAACQSADSAGPSRPRSPRLPYPRSSSSGNCVSSAPRRD